MKHRASAMICQTKYITIVKMYRKSMSASRKFPMVPSKRRIIKEQHEAGIKQASSGDTAAENVVRISSNVSMIP